MLGPVVAGLWGTLAPALGWMPALGGTSLSLQPFQTLIHWPGFAEGVRLSIATGLAATILSLGITALITAALHGSRAFRWVQRALSPLLSVPHAAAAFGIAFLIAPSGWIARALSPWLTGWDTPLDVLILQDPWGIAMVLGLVAKEVPFLLLMTITALGQVPTRRIAHINAALGYSPVTGWFKGVFPLVYTQIRLPVCVVLAYSMSVVDVAIILGPNTPPPLAVQITRWMSDPDLSFRMVAAAGAVVQLVLVILALIGWRMAERAVCCMGLRWIECGARGHDRGLRPLAEGMALIVVLAVGLGLAGLAVWSVAGFWRYPEVVPDALTLRSWMRFGPAMGPTLITTVLIAGLATLAALILTIGCLEAEHRHRLRMTRRATLLLYLPLIVPQIAFLPGLQNLMLQLGLNSGVAAVTLTHFVFVLPYVFLSFSAPYRAWDARIATVGHSLGAGPWRVLFILRLPMLLAPVLTALAVGLAVSVGQYLPTLMIGGGRVQTLTTEALTLASGGDRRAIGVFGIVLTAAALVPFAAAVGVPALMWRKRRGMAHG